jgi:hypothetical protein
MNSNKQSTNTPPPFCTFIEHFALDLMSNSDGELFLLFGRLPCCEFVCREVGLFKETIPSPKN